VDGETMRADSIVAEVSLETNEKQAAVKEFD
jgi:hypothetical protein